MLPRVPRLLWLLPLLVACSGEGDGAAGGTGGGGGAAGSGGAGGAAAACQPECGPGWSCIASSCVCAKTDCGNGVCTTLETDELNCGTCGTKCPSNAICKLGECTCSCPANQVCDPQGSNTCACPIGWDMCEDGVCVDASTPEHCGKCGNACATGQACCALSCVDPLTDPSHCGACENACGVGETCQAGTCQ